MRRLRSWFVKLAGVFDRGRAERALADEIESHLALHTEENMRRGMPEAEARRAALLKLGGRDAVKEAYRDQRRPSIVGPFLQDARFALRTMRRGPGLAAVAVVTLALGIGANTAMFSIVYGVLLRPLPYADPSRLVFAFSSSPSRGFQNFGTCPPDFRELRARNRTFASLSAYFPASFNYRGSATAERLSAIMVSPEFFETLGVRPLLGRTFRREEGNWGSHRVVVLSEAFWRSRFGARHEILDTTMRLDGELYNVVGVMPAGFYFQGEQDLWAPMAWRAGDVQDSRNNYFMSMVGRLRKGVTLPQAHTDLDAIMASIAATYPENRGIVAGVTPLHERTVGDARRPLWVLLSAVGFVLLICCVNLSSLLLSRDAARRKEFALRAALGASRARLLRQFLTESVLLSFMGGVAAIGLAYLAVGQARRLAVDVPRIDHVTVDGAVLLFALMLSIAAGILAGIVPCFWDAAPDLNRALRQGGRVQSGAAAGGARGTLITVEVALAFVLTVGAALMMQSFGRLLHVKMGFDPQNVLTFSVSLPDAYTQPVASADFYTPPRVTAFYDSLIARIGRLPGVTAAGVASGLPLKGNTWSKYISLEDRPAPDSLEKVPLGQFRAVDGDFFRAVGATVRQGRPFDAGDQLGAPPVAIVNTAFVKRFFAEPDAVVGKPLLFNPPERLLPPGSVPPGFRFPRIRIVGVIDDIHFSPLNEDPVPEVYAPLAQSDFLSTMYVLVRTRTAPTALVPSIRAELAAIDRDLPMAHIVSMEEVIGEAAALPRLHTLLLGGFGILALGLAAVGLYGVIAQSVAQRRQEVGIRIALGARPQAIVGGIVLHAMSLVALGMLVGCGLSLLLTRLMKTLLFETGPTDVPTFLAAAGVLAITSVGASYLPARRAAAVDPIVTLRCD